MLQTSESQLSHSTQLYEQAAAIEAHPSQDGLDDDVADDRRADSVSDQGHDEGASTLTVSTLEAVEPDRASVSRNTHPLSSREAVEER